MKKLLAVIGVLFVFVVGLAIYNNNKTITKPQPVIANLEPTVSAPAEEIAGNTMQSKETEGPVVVEASFSPRIQD